MGIKEKSLAINTIHKSFYIWVNLLTPSSIDKIIVILVKRGYDVGPLEATRKPYREEDNNLNCVLALNIGRTFAETELKPLSIVYEDLSDILTFTKTKYFSFNISEPANCTWKLGNVVMVKEDKQASIKGVN